MHFVCYSCCGQALICVLVQIIKELCFKYPFSQVFLGFCIALGWPVHLAAVWYPDSCVSQPHPSGSFNARGKLAVWLHATLWDLLRKEDFQFSVVLLHQHLCQCWERTQACR